MIRVMHYYTTPNNSGGPMTYIYTITESELKDRYEFSVCFQEKTVKEIRPKDLSRIYNEIKNYAPDILHIHGLQSEGFIGVVLGRLAKVPNILMTVHGMNHEATAISKLKFWIFKYVIEPCSLRLSDYVYCVAKSAEKKDIIVRNSKRLLPCIQNATSYTHGIMVDRKKMGFQDDDIVVIVVGRVSIDKGMLTIEKVIDTYIDTNIKFLIVGEGDYSLVMQEKYKNIHNVCFTGFTDNPCGYLDIADIYLCASLHENMSIALLEAGQHSLPCIVTDVGDNADVVTNGKNGFVVEVGDSESICSNIDLLAGNKNLRLEMGEDAKRNIEENYSLQKMISRIDNVYQTILIHK